MLIWIIAKNKQASAYKESKNGEIRTGRQGKDGIQTYRDESPQRKNGTTAPRIRSQEKEIILHKQDFQKKDVIFDRLVLFRYIKREASSGCLPFLRLTLISGVDHHFDGVRHVGLGVIGLAVAEPGLKTVLVPAFKLIKNHHPSPAQCWIDRWQKYDPAASVHHQGEKSLMLSLMSLMSNRVPPARRDSPC